MSTPYRYLHLDVFTNSLFGGNQLAVFPDATGLSTETMQAMAKEMAYSESTFVLPKERPDTDIRMRIFTPGAEMPMAGHPTVGSTFALAWEKVIPAGQARWVFGLNIGPTPVDIDWRDGKPAFVWMNQNRPAFGPTLDAARPAAAMLGLDVKDLRHPALPIQEVSCGVPFLFVPLETRGAVDRAVPDRTALSRLCRDSGLEDRAVFVFSCEPGADKATVYSRMFAPNLGIYEDPATGSASGPLGCYLVRHGVVPRDRADTILSLQGNAMGRPSWIHIAIGTKGDEITSVRVGGESVLAGEGNLFI
jgi:trans-2,3-dihydro-3-hydroxyanthranilate isomerase